MGGSTKGLRARFYALCVALLLPAAALSGGCGETSGPAPGSETAVVAPTQGTSLTEQIPAIDQGQTIEAQVEDVALTPQARLLAERFMCVCGCGDILSTCSCLKTPGSRDMKQLLQRLVDEGKSPSEIKTEMVAVYGQAALP